MKYHSHKHNHNSKSAGKVVIIKKVIITTTVIGLLAVMLLAGCSSGASISRADLQVLAGLPARIDAQDTAISNVRKDLATAQGDINSLKAGGTSAADIAALKAANDQLNKDISALEKANADGDKALADLAAKVGTQSDTIAQLQAAVKALQPTTTPPPTTTPASTGLVTVVLDSSTPAQFNGASLSTFKININNGTNSYQYVGFFVNISLVQPAALAISGATLTTGAASYTPVYIPAIVAPPLAQNQQIIFTPPSKILVPPGVTSMYYMATISPSLAAVWNFGISNVTYSISP